MQIGRNFALLFGAHVDRAPSASNRDHDTVTVFCALCRACYCSALLSSVMIAMFSFSFLPGVVVGLSNSAGRPSFLLFFSNRLLARLFSFFDLRDFPGLSLSSFSQSWLRSEVGLEERALSSPAKVPGFFFSSSWGMICGLSALLCDGDRWSFFPFWAVNAGLLRFLLVPRFAKSPPCSCRNRDHRLGLFFSS